MDKLLFSIIIPTYNRAHLIGDTLRSAIDQTYKEFEIIVVDDGSTDNTEELVRSFADQRIVYLKTQNNERAAARNFGLERAKGDYVTFLDSDDLLYSNHLKEAFNFITKTRAEVFFQQYEILKPDGSKEDPYLPKSSPINKELVLKGNFMSCHGVFISMKLTKQFRFNEDRELTASEDYELWLRIAAEFPIHYSSKITNALVQHDERSVLSIDPTSLIKRKEKMLYYLESNSSFMKNYGNYWNSIRSDAYSYLSLHLALAKERSMAIQYLMKAISAEPKLFFKKRLWSILYRLLGV